MKPAFSTFLPYVYVLNYNVSRQLLLLRYFVPVENARGTSSLSVGGRWRKALHEKTILAADPAYIEKRAWFSLGPFDGGAVQFRFAGEGRKIVIDGVPASEWAVSAILGSARATPARASWLICDRPDRADDNGEHFYRHIQRSHPDQEIYFVLRSSSPDWARLHAENFRLLDPDSPSFAQHVATCGIVLDSSGEFSPGAGSYCLSNYPRSTEAGALTYVFLQHGVTKDNISAWLNRLQADLIVTSVPFEVDELLHDESTHYFGEPQVLYTGMPRHDALHARVQQIGAPTTLLVAPTWRAWLKGMTAREFQKSGYLGRWRELLRSPRLHELAAKHELTIVLAVHPSLRMYQEFLDLPAAIRVAAADESYINLMANAAVLLTDYSSVALDLAGLRRSAVFYQFDEKRIASGGHTYLPGRYSYHTHGTGPVVATVDDALSAMADVLEGTVNPTYTRRSKALIPGYDGLACARLYTALCQLRHPYQPAPMSLQSLGASAFSPAIGEATAPGDWAAPPPFKEGAWWRKAMRLIART